MLDFLNIAIQTWAKGQLTELRAKEDIHWENNLGERPKPLIELSSLVGKLGVQEV